MVTLATCTNGKNFMWQSCHDLPPGKKDRKVPIIAKPLGSFDWYNGKLDTLISEKVVIISVNILILEKYLQMFEGGKWKKIYTEGRNIENTNAPL